MVMNGGCDAAKGCEHEEHTGLAWPSDSIMAHALKRGKGKTSLVRT